MEMQHPAVRSVFRCRRICVSLQSAAVFALCGDPAADVPLRLVFFKDFFDLKIQRSVVKRQSLLNILMYRALTDTELLGGFPHGGAVFDDVCSQLAGALLDVTFQDKTRSLSRYETYICTWEGEHAARHHFSER